MNVFIMWTMFSVSIILLTGVLVGGFFIFTPNSTYVDNYKFHDRRKHLGVKLFSFSLYAMFVMVLFGCANFAITLTVSLIDSAFFPKTFLAAKSYHVDNNILIVLTDGADGLVDMPKVIPFILYFGIFDIIGGFLIYGFNALSTTSIIIWIILNAIFIKKICIYMIVQWWWEYVKTESTEDPRDRPKYMYRDGVYGRRKPNE